MPTELFCGALASCFCLAIGHVARKRSIEVPGAHRDASARERAGRELRYARLVVACAADVDDALARHADRARPAVLLGVEHAGRRRRGRVSSPLTIRQRSYRIGNTPRHGPPERRRARRGPRPRRPPRPRLRPPRLRDARVGRPVLRPRRRAARTPPTRRCSPTLVATNARHMMLFRERAAANGTDPDAYTCPDEGEAIYDRIPELYGADELVGYALGSLDHFAELLAVYRAAADGRRRGGDRHGPRRRRPRAGRAARPRRRRRRARRRTRRTSSTASASWPRCRSMRMPPEAALPTFADLQRELPAHSPRAWRFAAQRAASRAGALVSDGLRIGYRHGFESGPVHGPRLRQPSRRGARALGRAIDRRLLRRRTCVAFRDIRVLAERAIGDALAATDAPAPVVADLAAGPAPYLLRAVAGHPGARAVICDIDAGGARRRARRGRSARPRRPRDVRPRRRVRPRRARRARPRPDVVARARPLRHLPRRRPHRAPLRRPRRARRARPDRLQRADPQPGDRVHRAGVAQRRGRALRVAPAAGRADPRLRRGGRLRAGERHRGPLRDLPRRAARPRGGAAT